MTTAPGGSEVDDGKTAAQSSSPMLAMLVDTTSFDETDDFGVNTNAIASEEWGGASDSVAPSGPPVMMSNGKVRRRMRWKPKSMIRKPRPIPLSQHLEFASQSRVNKKKTPSDASISSFSNSSFASRISKRSEHSFGSMETLVKSNTTKAIGAKQLKLPLSRPNYPSKLDEHSVTTIEGTLSMMDSVKEMPGLSPSIEWTATNDSIISRGTRPQLSVTHDASSSRKGLPPLFRKALGQRRQQNTSLSLSNENLPSHPPEDADENGTDATSVTSSIVSQPDISSASNPQILATDSAESTPRQPDNSSGGPSESPQPSSTDDTATLNAQHDGPDVLPSLSGEDVERVRRVDLRICKTGMERRLSFGRSRSNSQKNAQTHDSDNSRLCADELLSVIDAEKAIPMDSDPDKRRDSVGASPGQKLPNLLAPPASSAENSEDDSLPMSQSQNTGQTLPVVSENKPENHELRFALSESQNDIFETLGPTFDTNTAVRRSGRLSTTIEIGPGGKPMTVPVDLDDGTFLEAEKNLKAIHEMAQEHLNQGEYSEALEVFEEILRGQLARYGQSHYRIGTALHNIGIVHMRRGDYEKAIDVYRDAVTVRKLTLTPDHPDVAVSLAQIGVAYLETLQHKQAVAAFREALKIRRAFYGPMHPKVAKVLNNIGCALYELNEIDVAKVAFDEALEIQRHNLRDVHFNSNSVSNAALLSVASTLSNIGSIKLYSGQFDEASVVLEEALLIQQCVYGDEHPIPQQTEHSLIWIEKTTKSNPFSSSPFDIFAILTKAFSIFRMDSSSSTSHLQRGILTCSISNGSVENQTVKPLTNSLLEAVEQRLVNSIETACGDDTARNDDEMGLRPQIDPNHLAL